MGCRVLKFKLIASIAKALGKVAAATKKDSEGGKKITPGERDEIIGAILDAAIDHLEPMVSDDARK